MPPPMVNRAVVCRSPLAWQRRRGRRRQRHRAGDRRRPELCQRYRFRHWRKWRQRQRDSDLQRRQRWKRHRQCHRQLHRRSGHRQRQRSGWSCRQRLQRRISIFGGGTGTATASATGVGQAQALATGTSSFNGFLGDCDRQGEQHRACFPSSRARPRHQPYNLGNAVFAKYRQRPNPAPTFSAASTVASAAFINATPLGSDVVTAWTADVNARNAFNNNTGQRQRPHARQFAISNN